MVVRQGQRLGDEGPESSAVIPEEVSLGLGGAGTVSLLDRL